MFRDHALPSGDSWSQCIKQFAEAVKHITGQGLGVSDLEDSHTLALHQEMQSLRAQVDEMTSEVSPSALYTVSEYEQVSSAIVCEDSSRIATSK